MVGFGSAKFGQANFGRGVIQSNACIIPETVNVDVFPYVEYQGWFDPQVTTNVDIFGGLTLGAYIDIEADTDITASGILMTWAGWAYMGVATSTVQISGHIAWDSQLVDDTVWTTQIID